LHSSVEEDIAWLSIHVSLVKVVVIHVGLVHDYGRLRLVDPTEVTLHLISIQRRLTDLLTLL
jgi:hypothetical protein